MGVKSAVGLLVCLSSCWATAAVIENSIALTRTKPGSTQSRVVRGDMGRGCRFAVEFAPSISGRVGNGGSLEFGGGGIVVAPLPASWRSNLSQLYFEMTCRNRGDRHNPQPSGRYDDSSNKWVKDVNALHRELSKSSDYTNPQFLQRTVDTIRIYNIKTPNAEGWADTGDDLYGDEQERKRTMIFCVYRGDKALCGNGDVAYLHDGQKGDLTQHALKIIRSIEFLD